MVEDSCLTAPPIRAGRASDTRAASSWDQLSVQCGRIFNQEFAYSQIIQVTDSERPDGVAGGADDRLLMDIEARVDDRGNSCKLSELFNDPVIASVFSAGHELRASRVVHVDDSRAVLLCPARTVEGDCHEPGRVLRSGHVIVGFFGMLIERRGSKRHEFGPSQLLVEPIIDRTLRRGVKN